MVSDAASPVNNIQSGDDKVPSSVLSVETLDGQIVYKGTPAEPLIKYETCFAELKQKSHTMRLWTVVLLKVEISGSETRADLTDFGPRRRTLCPACPSGINPTGGITGAIHGHLWMPLMDTPPLRRRVLRLLQQPG